MAEGAERPTGDWQPTELALELADTAGEIEAYLAELGRFWAEEEQALIQEVAEQTTYGAILLEDLIRRQLRLGLGVAALFIGGLFSLPIAYLFMPELMGLRLFGLPLGWLIPAAIIYPFVWALAWFYAHRARRYEEEFRELLR